MCYSRPASELLEELLHTFFGKMVVDLSPANGKLVLACLQNRMAYLGVTYNEVHSKLFEERRLDLMKDKMADPSNREPFGKTKQLCASHRRDSHSDSEAGAKAKPESKDRNQEK